MNFAAYPRSIRPQHPLSLEEDLYRQVGFTEKTGTDIPTVEQRARELVSVCFR
jgi:hypothetical protein